MCSAVVIQEVLQKDEKLEGEQHSGQPLEVDNDKLRAIIEADPLTTTREVYELKVDHTMAFEAN